MYVCAKVFFCEPIYGFVCFSYVCLHDASFHECVCVMVRVCVSVCVAGTRLFVNIPCACPSTHAEVIVLAKLPSPDLLVSRPFSYFSPKCLHLVCFVHWGID